MRGALGWPSTIEYNGLAMTLVEVGGNGLAKYKTDAGVEAVFTEKEIMALATAMTRNEKLKKLAVWRWEFELLDEFILNWTAGDMKEFDAVSRHAWIVRALIKSAEKELGS